MLSENKRNKPEMEDVKTEHLDNIGDRLNEHYVKNGKNGLSNTGGKTELTNGQTTLKENEKEDLLKKEIEDIIEKDTKEVKNNKQEILNVLYQKKQECEKKISQVKWREFTKRKKLQNTFDLLSSVHQSIFFKNKISQESLDKLLKIEDLGDIYLSIKDDASIEKLGFGQSIDNIEYVNKKVEDENLAIRQRIELENKNRKQITEDLRQPFKEEEIEKEEVGIDAKLKTIGLDENYFKDNPEWQNFSRAEKLLIIEQASQDTLSKVKELGEKRFEEKNTITGSFNPIKWKPVSFGKKVWNKIRKSYWISKEEKNIIKEVKEGKVKPDEKVLNSLIEIQSDLKLPVIEKGGKAFVEFESTNKDLSEEQKDIINKYNEAANSFSHIPQSWINERAAQSTDKIFSKEKNHKKFEEAKNLYEEERAILIESKVKQYKSEEMSEKEAESKAMLDLQQVDLKIGLMQGAVTNPDAIEELSKIKREISVGRLANNENIWRAGYMGAGYTAKATLIGAIGWATVPITAGVIGGVRARRKANENINKSFNEGRKEETFLERKELGKKGLFDNKNEGQGALSYVLQGEKVNTKEVAGFIDADSQKQRIENLVNKINNTKDNNERASLVAQLDARLFYIELKQSQGLVNLGKENPTASNYELFKAMSEAYVISTTIDNLEIPLTKEMEDNLRERNTMLTSIMARNEEAFGEKIASHKNAEMLRGLLMGASFGALGGLIGEWMHKGAEHVAEIVKNSTVIEPIAEVAKEVIKEVSKYVKVEVIASHGQGAIAMLRELQHNLKEAYTDLSKAPESVRHVLGTDADKLAQEYGLYKPGEKLESALIKAGDKLSVDEMGDVRFGDTLLEKASSIKVDNVYNGKMINAN